MENFRTKVASLAGIGTQTQPALDVIRKYDTLSEVVKDLKNDRECQQKALSSHRAACDDLDNFLSLLRERKQQALGDKLFDVEAANSVFTSLINKKPQASILHDRLLVTGQVVMANASKPEKEAIAAEMGEITEKFESLFQEIQRDSDNLGTTLAQLTGWREEYSRLSDWLQQNEILIKNAKTTLLSAVPDKNQKVMDTRDVIAKLVRGEEQMNRFNDSSVGLLKSHLDKYVSSQLQSLNSRYKVNLLTCCYLLQ